MAKDPYEGSGNPQQCGHPRQSFHDYPEGKRVVYCPDCGMEWSA